MSGTALRQHWPLLLASASQYPSSLYWRNGLGCQLGNVSDADDAPVSTVQDTPDWAQTTRSPRACSEVSTGPVSNRTGLSTAYQRSAGQTRGDRDRIVRNMCAGPWACDQGQGDLADQVSGMMLSRERVDKSRVPRPSCVRQSASPTSRRRRFSERNCRGPGLAPKAENDRSPSGRTFARAHRRSRCRRRPLPQPAKNAVTAVIPENRGLY